MRVSVAVVGAFLLFFTGCNKLPDDRIRSALSASSATFRPNRSDPIPLSRQQTESIKRIVAKFRDKKHVAMQADILGLQHGHFLLGAETFSWQGSMLYIREGQRRNWVVSDPALAAMADAYMKAHAESPYQMSKDAWQQILSELKHN